MSRKRVAVDIDDVLYKWIPTAWYMLVHRFPELDPDAYHGEWLKIGVAGITTAQWKWLWSDPQVHDVHRFGHVVRGAVDTVRALAESYDLLAVTARPRDVIEETFDFVKVLPFVEVHILSNQPKTSVPFDALVDDKAENLQAALDAGRRAVCFDQPWNHDFASRSPRWRRALSWDDVPRALEELFT